MPIVALLNRSKLDDADVAFMAAAVDAQLREDLVPRWLGVDYTPVVFFASEKDLPVASGIARLMIIRDTIDVEGASGYHDFQGVPRSIILAEGARTSITISHEAIEMTIDPEADKWVRMPDGRRVATEAADPVEADSYAKSTTILGVTRDVEVSEFVGPQWFQPGSPGAFKVSPGGYMIVSSVDGQISYVHGLLADVDRIAAKLGNPGSRMRRRGLAPF